METISFSCPECGGTIKAPVTVAGKTGKCPKCDARIVVPMPEAEGNAAPADTDHPPRPRRSARRSRGDDAPRASTRGP